MYIVRTDEGGLHLISRLASFTLSIAVALGSGSTSLAQSPSAHLSVPAATIKIAETAAAYQIHNRVVGQYCVSCHNDVNPTAGLSLESFDVAHAHENAEVAEKIIRKLQAGMMPPPPLRRPDKATVKALVTSLAGRIDDARGGGFDSGGRTFQRLNRPEYERSVRDLLNLEIDAGAYLPPDTISEGFDNVADVQGLSVTVMQGYLAAAGQVSRLALGNVNAAPSAATYSVSRFASQRDHVTGAPVGTRGGLSVLHHFPADAEYTFTMDFYDSPIAALFGMRTLHDEQIEISIDGEQVARLDIDRWMNADNGLLKVGQPIFVRAGPHRVSAAFLQRFEGPVEDTLSPHEWSLADKKIGSSYGITSLPHLQDLIIGGPYRARGVSATPSRDNIFSCRPTAPDEELPCARAILSRLATEAYRRPLSSNDLEALVGFYKDGAATGGFETGIRDALQAILASPYFIFRFEEAAVSELSSTASRISDMALASRLSFFLWATAPDNELVELAQRGRLSHPPIFEAQVTRMLADLRATSLGTRFAAQWLRLQDLYLVHPDAVMYPDFPLQLATAMRHETELLFNHLVKEDRSVLELLTADYTFVNERLARHYGIPGVAGQHFRKVPQQDLNRRGVLGHGSFLTLTSHSNRTSPVLRGKWVMEVLLGTPPPPPPPDVPDLEDSDFVGDAELTTVRERLEQHRADPSCMSCHRVIDPLGLALENFDIMGAWRINDNGAPIQASGELYDGTELESPIDLQRALLNYSDAIVTNFAKNLMGYGLGRRIDYTDMPTIRAIVAEAAEKDFRMSAFIRGIVNSTAFRNNNRALRAQVADVDGPEY